MSNLSYDNVPKVSVDCKEEVPSTASLLQGYFKDAGYYDGTNPFAKSLAYFSFLMSFTSWCSEVTHLSSQSLSFFTYKMEIIKVPGS